ncbi:hypothetical protein MRX96_041173 [Rhipicephalus microplus]
MWRTLDPVCTCVVSHQPGVYSRDKRITPLDTHRPVPVVQSTSVYPGGGVFGRPQHMRERRNKRKTRGFSRGGVASALGRPSRRGSVNAALPCMARTTGAWVTLLRPAEARGMRPARPCAHTAKASGEVTPASPTGWPPSLGHAGGRPVRDICQWRTRACVCRSHRRDGPVHQNWSDMRGLLSRALE